MCLATPTRVIKIKNQWADVESGNHRHQVNLSLLKIVKKGDYLLAHDDLAIKKISKKEAEEILNMINEPNR